jgi:hypothetical protein
MRCLCVMRLRRNSCGHVVLDNFSSIELSVVFKSNNNTKMFSFTITVHSIYYSLLSIRSKVAI